MRLRERGINPREAKEQDAQKAALAEQTTFAHVAEQWLQVRQRALAPVTYKRLEERTRTHLLPALGGRPVPPSKIVGYIQNIQESRRHYGSLSIFVSGVMVEATPENSLLTLMDDLVAPPAPTDYSLQCRHGRLIQRLLDRQGGCE